jgi:hypothetical protein
MTHYARLAGGRHAIIFVISLDLHIPEIEEEEDQRLMYVAGMIEATQQVGHAIRPGGQLDVGEYLNRLLPSMEDIDSVTINCLVSLGHGTLPSLEVPERLLQPAITIFTMQSVKSRAMHGMKQKISLSIGRRQACHFGALGIVSTRESQRER